MEHFVIHGNYACFYGGCFSQWYMCNFVDIKDDIKFNCAEQAMMYRKAELFNDTDIMKKILNSNHPKEQKALGRNVRNFDADVWNNAAKNIAYNNNILKFSQNSEILNMLLSTQNLIIVEASPIDTIWGIGRALDFPDIANKDSWRGTNWLGEVLTKVRDDLKKGSVL